MKIFIIAGEDSGDKLGSEIIDSLKSEDQKIQLAENS